MTSLTSQILTQIKQVGLVLCGRVAPSSNVPYGKSLRYLMVLSCWERAGGEGIFSEKSLLHMVLK